MAINLDQLVDLAYSAAVEDDLWRVWTHELVEQSQSPGALFWVIDNNRFDMCQNHMCFPGTDAELVTHEYLEEHVRDDPQMRRVCTVRSSEIYLDIDHVDYTDPLTRRYMAWQEATVGSAHHITASVVLGDGLEAGVSLHRTREQGPAGEEIQAQMRALFPDFARALRLGFLHAQGVHEGWWDGLATGGRHEARILLTEGARVIRFNPAADAICRRHDGLQLKAERLSCLDPRSDEALAAAMALACNRHAPRGSSLAIRRKGGRSEYLVSVYPLTQRRRFLAPYGAAAMVCITDPSAHFDGMTPEQKAMLQLTSKEAQLAELLRNGHSLASAAEIMQITYNTARVHLGALFRKTNTTRQAELMLFLERIE